MTTAPPVGSRAELAITRAGQGGMTAVPQEIDFHEPTNPHATDLERMIKATGRHVIDETSTLRSQVEDEMINVNQRIDESNRRMWNMNERITEVSGRVENMDGKLDVVLNMVTQQVQAGTNALTAQIDLNKANGLVRMKIFEDDAAADRAQRLEDAAAARNERTEKGKWSRSMWGLLITTILSGTGIVALLLQRC